jgi:uroporphyrinogen-III synthase
VGADSTSREFELARGGAQSIEWSMNLYTAPEEQRDIDFLHEIGEKIASEGPIYNVLKQIVDFVSTVLNADSCFVYLLEDNELTLRASRNPHQAVVNRLKLRMGQGITGWVAENKKPVAVASKASMDPRFKSFSQLPEDHYEAFLAVPILCREKLVGVINVQHREPYAYSQRDVRLVSTIGFLIGPAIEMARMETENLKWAELSEALKMVDAAKSILQRDLQLTAEEADGVFQKQSRSSRRSPREIAEAILLNDEIRKSQEFTRLP